MTDLYFHIGTPKTGTTAIQHFMAKNRQELKNHGVVYPILPYRFHRVTPERNGHFAVVTKKNGDVEAERRLVSEAMDKVAEAANGYSTVVLSDETLWNAAERKKPGFWKYFSEESAKHGFNLKVIVYLRRQDDYIQSWYVQKVREFRDYVRMSFDEFIDSDCGEKVVLDYYEALSNISDAVGKENVFVRPYERQQFKNGNIIDDFLNILGLELTNDYTNPEDKSNLSMSGNQYEISNMINHLPSYYQFKENYIRGILTRAFSAQEYRPPKTALFSYEKQVAFLEKYKESNAKVAKEFLKRDDGRLFINNEVERLPLQTPDEKRLPYDLVYIFGEQSVYFYKKYDELKTIVTSQQKQIDKLQKRIELHEQKTLKQRIKRIIKKILGK